MRAHTTGKSSIGGSDQIDYDELYPPFVSELQARLIDEAVCLGQGLALEVGSTVHPEVNRELPPIKSIDQPIPNVSVPEKFDGSRAEFENFTTNLQLHFRSNPQAFKSEESKIIYAGTYLRGSAYSWFKPHIDPSTGAVSFLTYASFIEALGAAFDDPDAYATAERELETIRQTGSCANYYAHIVSIFSRLKWQEEGVKIHFLRKGLKTPLRMQLWAKIFQKFLMNLQLGV